MNITFNQAVSTKKRVCSAVCMVVECWEVGGVMVVTTRCCCCTEDSAKVRGSREDGEWRVATIYNNHHSPDQQLPGTIPSIPSIPSISTISTITTIPITTPLNHKSGLQGKSVPS